MSKLKYLLHLLFYPRLFIESFLQDAKVAEKDRDECRKDFTTRVRKKRKGMLLELITVFIIVFIAYQAAYLINNFFPTTETVILSVRLLSLVVIAWAVLSRLGYESDTWKGESLLERTSLITFKSFYLMGIFFGVLSLFLRP